MLVTEDDDAESNFVFLTENLLAPYSHREVDEPTERAPINDRLLLRRIADIYGPHSIFERAVSCEIGESERGIERVPHRWGSLQKLHS
jgi:hypothetical protein